MKDKKPFDVGAFVEDAFLNAVYSLFDQFKNKSEIISVIEGMELLNHSFTMNRRDGTKI